MEFYRSSGIVYAPALTSDFSYKSAVDSIFPGEVKEKFGEIKLDPARAKIVLSRTGADPLYSREAYFRHYLDIRPETVIWLLDQGIRLSGVHAFSVDGQAKPTPYVASRAGILPYGEPD